MRSRALSVVGISAMALALAATLSPMASAQSAGPSAVQHSSAAISALPVSSDALCAGNNGAPNGDGISAQNFEAEFDAYDNEGAADFKIPAGTKCKVKTVAITGQFSAAGPSESITMTISKNDGGVPGAEKCTATLAAPGPNYVVPFTDCRLRAGKYWLHGYVTMSFTAAGQWYWNTTNDQLLTDDLWRNPGDGFASGCTDWGTILNCIGLDYEYLFAINGRVIT